MQNCKWCGECVTLIKGYCFECHYMGVVESMGYEGTFETYQALSTDVDTEHWVGWLLKNELYLFGQGPMFLN